VPHLQAGDPVTPAEHREEALRLLAAGREYHPAAAQRLTLATEAQVHATLSLREAPEPVVVVADLDEHEAAAVSYAVKTANEAGVAPVLVLDPSWSVEPTPGALVLRREAPEPLAEVTSPAPEKKPAPRKRTPARKSPATPKETPAP